MPRLNPLKLDPSRTLTLRRRFEADLRRRFVRLRKRLVQLVKIEDAFGLGPRRHNPFALNTRWQYQSSAEQLTSFQGWLAAQTSAEFSDPQAKAQLRVYIEDGFRRGAGRAFDDARPRAHEPLDFYQGTREEFLRSAFGQRIAADKVRLLAGRTFEDLKGITADMSARMSRVLTDGLVRGASPNDVALDLAAQVGLSEGRARLVAQGEIVRAHAEGQLQALEQLGVEEVGVQAEWSTSKKGNVCPLCADMEGQVFTLEEAHGLIPLHPHCACTWIPHIPARLLKEPVDEGPEPEVELDFGDDDEEA